MEEKAKKACLDNGVCIECGCKMPNLQYADKSCAGNCYPPMLDSESWDVYKFVHKHIRNGVG